MREDLMRVEKSLHLAATNLQCAHTFASGAAEIVLLGLLEDARKLEARVARLRVCMADERSPAEIGMAAGKEEANAKS